MSAPVEALHTMVLGAIKYLLEELRPPKMNAMQKKEILARLRAFNTSGMRVKLYGNVCQYYQSFLGRDFEVWAQMAIFIISPYLDEEQKAVLLCLSKVLHELFLKIIFFNRHLFTFRCFRSPIVNSMQHI